jgi:putative heme degradation protein
MSVASFKRQQLIQLFRDAGAAHHRAFLATNGDDPAWPAWYAEWLAPRLQALLGMPFAPARLETQLKALEDRRQARGLADWPSFYADSFLVGT